MAKLSLTFIMLLMTCSLFTSSLAYVAAPPPRLVKCPEPRPYPASYFPFGCAVPHPIHRETHCVIYKDGSVKEQFNIPTVCICNDPKVDSVFTGRCNKRKTA